MSFSLYFLLYDLELEQPDQYIGLAALKNNDKKSEKPCEIIKLLAHGPKPICDL